MALNTAMRSIDHWRDEARRALPDAEPDLVEEIAQHADDQWTHLVGNGTAPAEADARARLEILEWRHRHRVRRLSRARIAAGWAGLLTDLRRAPRAFRTHPALTIGGVVLSAIATAGAVGAFVVVYGVLFRPMPYPDAARLAVIWQRGAVTQISYPDLTDLAGSSSVFDAVSAIGGGRASLRVGDEIQRVNSIGFEPTGLAMLGAAPYLGRLLTPADADSRNVLISHRLWRGALGADPSVVGRVFWLSGQEITVVGVLPPGFDFELPVPPAFRLEQNDIWRIIDRRSPMLSRRSCSCFESLVRLAPGVSLSQAQAAIDAVGARLAIEHPDTNALRQFRLAALHDEVVDPVRRPLLLVAIAGAVMLVVALANLVVLGLSRWSARQVEFTIRAAIGATAPRLRRQMFCESALIALIGGAAGGALAYQLVTLLRASEAAHLPRIDALQFDSLGLSSGVLIALLATTALSWYPFRLQPGILQAGSRATDIRVQRSRRILVALEVAMALVLASSSALMTLSISRLLHVDPGFDPGAAGAARISAYAERYPSLPASNRFFESVLAQLREMPGITLAGAGSSLPLSGQTSGTGVVAQGSDATSEPLNAGWQVITPGYLGAVGLRLKKGRDFAADDQSRPGHITLITEGLAQSLFPGQDPIGRLIGIGGDGERGHWHEIVGIVGDVRHRALDAAPEPRVFDLLGQHSERTLYVVARSGIGSGIEAVRAIRRASSSVDSQAPLFEAATLQSLVERSAASRRFASQTAFQLAATGVLLTLIAVYAVTRASVAEQTREIGIRTALGASKRDVLLSVSREAMSSALVGAASGVLASLALGGVLQSQLFGVTAVDRYWVLPLTVVGVTLTLLAAALPAARRAASIDPLSAMRTE